MGEGIGRDTENRLTATSAKVARTSNGELCEACKKQSYVGQAADELGPVNQPRP